MAMADNILIGAMLASWIACFVGGFVIGYCMALDRNRGL